MEKMYESYVETLKAVNEQLRDTPTEENPERHHLSSAASDLRYIIEWMETGYLPLPRDASRLSGEQREVPYDPMDYRFIAMTAKASGAKGITDDERDMLHDVLNDKLTAKEREVFITIHGGLLSQRSAAKILGISKSTVQTLLERAEKKLKPIAEKVSDQRERIIQRSMFE